MKGQPGSGSESAELENDRILKEYTLLESIQGLDFWILFCAIMGGCGAGLTLINNLGQIIPSYRSELSSYDQGTLTASLTSLIGICNCCGRLLAGIFSDVLVQRQGLPRPYCFGFACLLMASAHGALQMNSLPSIYSAAILGGLSFGMMNALNPMIASEVFGQKHMGAHYATLSISMAAASYLLATRVASSFYSEHSLPGSDPLCKANDSDGRPCCIGKVCFQRTTQLCCLLSVVAAGLLFLLGARSKARYERMYARVL